jgi:PAS domain S-box-containing protein
VKKQAPTRTKSPSEAARDASIEAAHRFWAPFRAYNALPANERSGAFATLGIAETDPAVVGVLAKSHFVIPGETRFSCTQCGECCRYAKKVAQLTYEPCPFLTEANTCGRHETRYLVCRWFPYWLYPHPKYGPMLTIKPYCEGVGQGPIVDYPATVKELQGLSTAQSEDADGAVVIHEVLLIPGRKDWAFPSKTNIDALIHFIQAQQPVTKPLVTRVDANGVERVGDVNFAHHYTSGLLGSINAAFVTVNEDGFVTDANAAACLLYGHDRQALVGCSFASLFVNPERATASVGACFARGRANASPHRLRHPDGSVVPVLLDALVYRDRVDGLVHGILVCSNPVSASVFSDINRSITYARGLLEASLDALMVIDKDGAITDVNEATVAITGRTREGLTGLPFRDLFLCRDKAAAGVEQTFRDGVVKNYELTFVTTTGEQIPVSFNASVYKDDDGVVQGVFAAARDIRERLALIERLEAASRQ